MSSRAFRRALLPFLFLTAAFSANAATTEIAVLIDSDNNASTGCSINISSGVFNGAEQVVTTTYDDVTGSVGAVTRSRCVGSLLGAPETIDTGGWAVGTVGAVNLVEIRIPWPTISAGGPIRFGFTVTSGLFSSGLFERPDGSLIMFPGRRPSGRSRVVNPTGEAAITLDGDGRDWSGIQPAAAGLASVGSSALRFLAIYLAETQSDLFLRFDIQANTSGATPP